jgi:hypothetical protein
VDAEVADETKLIDLLNDVGEHFWRLCNAMKCFINRPGNIAFHHAVIFSFLQTELQGKL